MKQRLLLSLLILLTSVGCDQVSKRAATQWLEGEPMRSYLGDTVRLLYIENTGAFLGLGANWPEIVRFTLLTLLSSLLVVLALGWLVIRLWRGPRALPWVPAVAALVLLAGGVGNLVDRVTRNGAVVDFLNVGIGSLRTGIFNVADVQIMAGALVLILWERRQAKRDSGLVGGAD